MTRVVGPETASPVPVYPDLVDALLAPDAGERNNVTVAHVLATCASYCSGDLDTVATIAVRLGFDSAASCGSSRPWQLQSAPTTQMNSLRDIPRSVFALLGSGSRRTGSQHYAVDAHPPHRYLDVLRPAGRLTEFGD